MFTKMFRRIASKIVIATMLFTAISPFANNAYALNGTLTVGFNHIDGGFEVRDVNNNQITQKNSTDCPDPGNGYFTCQLSLPTGFYTVNFTGSVTDFDTPQSKDVQLSELGATVLGTYVPEGGLENGVLGVAVNHMEGGFQVFDVQNNEVINKNATDCGAPQGSWYVCQMSLPTGFYTVKFKTVNDFATPNNVDIQLSEAGGTVWGQYTIDSPTTGTLNVGINHINGGYTIYDVNDDPLITKIATECGPAQPNGYFICQQALPTGFYTVKFNSVGSFVTPKDVDIQLSSLGGTVWGNYIPEGSGNGLLTVAMNNQNGGYRIYNAFDNEVASKSASSCGPAQSGWYKCEQSLPTGFYTVEFNSVGGFITPGNIDIQLSEAGGTVWGYYAVQPSGIVEVRIVDQNDNPIIDLPGNEWQLKKCTSSNPASCFQTMASGGTGNIYQGLDYSTYRIVFPSPAIPAGYNGRTVLPNVYQVLDAQHTSLIFTIKYTKTTQSTGVAYVNARTTPVKANVKMVTLAPPQADQQAVTSDLVNGVPTYDLANPDRFTLPTTANGFTASTNYYIECPPAPGGYHAPASTIQVNNAVYAKDSETLAGTCQYTAVPANEQVTITVDTIGVEQAAIYVDGVEVRPTTSNAEVPVIITTTELHTITFENKDPGNFTAPPGISIPPNTLNSGMTADQLKYLGYYVALGNLATAEVGTQNQNGWVYLSIGTDPTKWNVGYADTTPVHLIVHFNETVNHQFHFQDRNADTVPYALRAVPITTAGFAVAQAIVQNGNNVASFQENYVYTAPQALTTVYLTGDYIADSNAAFFRARTTNAAPVSGEIYLDINAELPAETLNPGAQNWTRVFISDVTNDNDTASFESPITVNTVSYTAVPSYYDLNTYSPGTLVNDLESTYIAGTTDLTVQLISLDPLIPPTAGLIVTLDSTITQPTVNNAGSIETTFVSVSPSVDHDVTCPAIAGLAPPNDIHIPSGTLQPGDNIVQCIYAPLATAAEILIQTEAEDDADLTAPITLSINGTDYSVGSTVSSNPALPATLSLWIDSADTNIIKYGDMTPTYINPADDPVNVTPGSSWQDPNPANIYTGTYTLPAAAGANLTFHLRELDPDNGPVINTNVTVNAATQQSDSNGDTTFTGVAVNQAIDVTFGNHPLGPGAYTTPIPVSFLAGELTDGQNYDFTIYYVPVASSVTLDVQTLDEATQLINVNGAISLIVNGSQPALYGYGTAAIVVSNDSQYSYQIDWGPTDPASQYIEPAIDPVAVDVSALSGGAHLAVDGLYRVCSSGNCEVVTITAWDETGLAILNSVSITLNSVVVGNGQHIGTYDVGAVLNIEFEDVPTHGIPEVRVNGVNIGNIHTTQYTVLDAPSPNTVDAYYALDGNSVGFNVGTRDNQDNPLTENITHGITGTETTEPTPAFFAVVQTDLVNYIINFADRPGYITPGSITVQNQAIATVPSSVLITNNGVPYVAGTQLVIGDTYDIVATYTPYFVIEKNITNEQVIFDNDKRVDYQIVVTRHPDTAPGSMNIDLHDTIADSNRTLTGSNGGTMTVVPQNGDYSICSNGCGDITAGPVNVAIDNPGNSVTITYQLLSDNTGIPASQSSDFINTLTGTFDDGGTPVVINTDATVNVLAAPGGGESGGTPGGGGGGGGGALMIKGDMILEVTKLVSLNNSNFIDASDPDKPLSISERVDSTLFTKVKVKNLGQVTATNIKYSEGFDSGDSKITTDDIQNVKGDTGVSFDDASNTITIDKLIVGAEVNFSYEQILHESGSKGKLAEEYLTLEGFSTKLTANQDGLTKHGIGDHYPSWLVAGGTTVVTSTGSPLQLSIQTDKAAARIGEEVNYTIIAKNNADFDFTGLVITWDYDENALEVLNPFGGRNTGTELHWSSGTLKPGQTVKYELRSRVKDTAPVGSNVRTTVRGLVNEIENPAVAEQYLTIIAGVSAGAVKLAQTGMPTFTLILASLLAYLVYTRTGRRRYLALKKAALRPL